MGRRGTVALLVAALGTSSTIAVSEAAATTRAAGCDDLDPHVCLLPFPSDRWTVPDRTTATGKRVRLPLHGMPANVAGVPWRPTDLNRADGFSPGSPIVTRLPGLDTPEALARTGAAPITDLRRSLAEDSPIVVLDAATGERQLHWAEVDLSVPADRSLIVRPAKNLREGRRYVVALRRLGVEPSSLFKAFRDGGPLARRDDRARRGHMERLFRTLARHGVARDDLVLAWDFTVASADSLAGRMLHLRDDAFARLGDRDLGDLEVDGAPPRWTLNSACDGLGELQELTFALVACGAETDERIVRDVKGTMTVPCYLSTPACAPLGSRFLLDRRGRPRRLPGNTMAVPFECRIPAAATAGGVARPMRISLYGHGLLGSFGEVRQGQLVDFANEHGIVFCATNWAGMATHDVPNVATILADLSNFPTLADRVQQGMLNQLLLGRLMLHPDGLASHPAFQLDGEPLLDTRALFYDGNSQGGIIGGALTAVAPDFTRATLGVPGMNYSTLLTRSVDFDLYAQVLYAAYPKPGERQLLFALMQMLWDRAEANGYAQHMTDDPYPGTPAHEVQLHVALGDHQVAPVSAEVEARTIGAKLLRAPLVAPGRSADREPFFGLEPFAALPAPGDSTLVVWDSGSPVPPVGNVPPREGADSHEHPRRSPANRAMKSAFLSTDSRVIDTCDGGPCRAAAGG